MTADRMAQALRDIDTVLRVEGMDLELGSRRLLKEVQSAIREASEPIGPQSPAEGDDMLEPLIYAAIMHSGRPKTIGDFEQAAANVADMLKRRANTQPKGTLPGRDWLEGMVSAWRTNAAEHEGESWHTSADAFRTCAADLERALRLNPREALPSPAPVAEVPPENLPTKEHIRELAQEALDQIMEQAQVFASAWSLVGGRFDYGNALSEAHDAKDELRSMVRSLADLAAETVRPAPCAAVAHERLRKFLDAAAGEGFELDGIDAGELFLELFPDAFKPPVQGSQS